MNYKWICSGGVKKVARYQYPAMALSHTVLGLPVQWRNIGNGGIPGRRRRFFAFATISSIGERRIRDPTPDSKSRSNRMEVPEQGVKRKMLDASALENEKIRGGVEIPVTCFKLLGITVQAEKDEIVKAVMELKNSAAEDGYTADAIASRQDLLMDVRDKLLFEPEYSGNIKEKIPPKSSLLIPWSWLPGALCLLQEVGEEKLVLEIGRAALQLPNAKAYCHDLLLSMALAECSIAKVGFEANKISEGFEALARAQFMLKSNTSLVRMPLLSQIEESLEDLAPACTLELLSLPHTPENAERRRGAVAALHELIIQGLNVEPLCRIQDWPCFLIQAMNKLTATEIVDLLTWDTLGVSRKNKKSIESQSQRVVLDFNCFYLAMIAHVALGFSTRQTEMIARAKTICECLIVSEGEELKFEEALCSFLLGEHGGIEAIEKLHQLVPTRSSNTQSSPLSMSGVDKNKDKCSVNQALETWLKDDVLCLFSDTRDCSPSLANFFGSPKRNLSGGNQKIGSKRASSTFKHVPPFALVPDKGTLRAQAAYANTTNHLGEAVKQLAPGNLHSQSQLEKATGSASLPSSQLKINLSTSHERLWEKWFAKIDTIEKIIYMTLVGCILFASFKLLSVKYVYSKTPHASLSHSVSRSASASDFMDRNVTSQLRKFWLMFRRNICHNNNVGSLQKTWFTDDLSSLPSATAAGGGTIRKGLMDINEAEALVKQWQDIKAEALGPGHQIELLPSILSESMLSKWQNLAKSAIARTCFWRFVLIQTSILRAEIVSDGVDNEMAEIEAVLEEAAELVDESEPKNPSYYSTYKVHYILRRQDDDGSWKFCSGVIRDQL